jgi:predicted anti-sigma-YlaC factor YlaD
MNASNHKNLCEEAELHYYDFICGQTRPSVPDLIVEHIGQCQHCRLQIEQLREALSETENQAESGQNRIRAAVTKALQLHFVYTDRYVTCGAARPFLPALSDPNLKIRIPTPITAHLDNCEQCRKDLEKLRKLDLDSGQLLQLAQILTGQPSEGSSIEPADMQRLQKIASQIAAQPESGVVTIYRIDKSAETEVFGESENPYAGLPIRVEVAGSKNRADYKRPAANYRRILKPAIAAAAVILIAVGLLINVPTAGL